MSYRSYFGYDKSKRRNKGNGHGGKADNPRRPEQVPGPCRCKSLAPELFALDEYGNAREAGDGSVPPGLEDKARLAQTNCPEIAIEVIAE